MQCYDICPEKVARDVRRVPSWGLDLTSSRLHASRVFQQHHHTLHRVNSHLADHVGLRYHSVALYHIVHCTQPDPFQHGYCTTPHWSLLTLHRQRTFGDGREEDNWLQEEELIEGLDAMHGLSILLLGSAPAIDSPVVISR